MKYFNDKLVLISVLFLQFRCRNIYAQVNICPGSTTRDITPTCIKDFAKNMTNVIYQRNYSLQATVLKMNTIMHGNSLNFRSAQIEYNSTDEILANFDYLSEFYCKNQIFETIDEENIIVQIFNIKETDIAGIVVYLKDGKRKSAPIYKNQTIADIMEYGSFLVAAYLPIKLLEQVERNLETPVAVITVFFRDCLFAETSEIHRTSGIVFGVIIPGFKEEFEVPIKLAYRILEGDTSSRECAHWLYGPEIKGSWNKDQNSLLCGEIEICEYYHITHFAMLVLDDTESIKGHTKALETITFIGSLLSIISYSIIYLTGCLFTKWRENKGNIILIHYAVASEIMIITMYISDFVKEDTTCDTTWCFWSGIFLHYIVLAQFFWILVISYLQYKRYVQVIGVPPTRLLLKATLFGWLGPLPIVIILGLTASDSYVKSNANICYPSGLGLYLGVIVPIIIVMITNVVVFTLIIRSIFSKAVEKPRLANNITILRTRLIVFLFFQLGFSWLFGLLANFGLAFAYLFCITVSSQGFIIFLIFIVFNSHTSQYYMKMFGYFKKDARAKESSSGATRSSSIAQQRRSNEYL